jgi:hypothetical protein
VLLPGGTVTFPKDWGYAKDLINVIGEKTQKDGFTIHFGWDFHKFYHRDFLDAGFETFRTGATEDFQIYRKK